MVISSENFARLNSDPQTLADLEPELDLITLNAGSLGLTSMSAQFLSSPC